MLRPLLSRPLLSAFAVLGTLVPAFRLSAQEITIEGTQFMAYGEPVWLNGINAAWIDWNDFGGGRFREFQTNPNDRSTRGWDEEIASYAAAGINSARIWIDCDGTHVLRYDAQGNVTGTVAGFIEDVGKLLDIGQKYGVYIMPVLTSFDHAREKTWESTWQNWRALLGDDAKIDSYIDNVVIPLVQAYPDHPYLFAWEICNEPEWMYAGDTEQRGTTRDRIVMFHARVAAAINKHTTKPVTTGTAGWQWMSSARGNFNGQLYSDASLQAQFDDPDARLDFYQIHYYGWMQSQGASPFDEGDTPTYFLGAAPDRPVIIGECPGLATLSGGAIKTVVEEYQTGWDNDYQGVMAWSSSGHDGAGTLPEIAVGTTRMARKYAERIAIARPLFATQPPATTIAPGGAATLGADIVGRGVMTYQWRKDGSDLPDATAATLTLTAVTATDAGDYTLVATSPTGLSTESQSAAVKVEALAPGKLKNLSVLAHSGTGGDVLTAGFVTNGGTEANLLIRAVAAKIQQPPYNVSGTLANAQLAAFQPDGTELARNDDWASASAETMRALGAFDLDAGSSDAVFTGSLPANTPVSVQVSDTSGGSGVAIAEIYDANRDLTGNRLVNLSARVRTGGSNGALTAGFVIDGNVPHRVLVRGIGPALVPFGVADALSDPTLRVVNTATGEIVAANDDWQDHAGGAPLVAASTTAGAFPLPARSLDAAVLITLHPGSYTVVVTNTENSSGVVLAEVYDLGER
ncbi:hypothetical protein [Synoicihabitans lomoniglobus]|uniref:Cellulase family glycosylhydrolase n=1 Tax=Synoicihabitans lomoniglobus TaxID=2909285 RepID=A0AAF0CRL8_9BACT|nr:cellulase family glycosylhydrolase [Opitutaceae bacterium LMO-M01]WED66800.1 cellulase family glycosylhydrolase [Opitutaceae bacterium LMO-M01]